MKDRLTRLLVAVFLLFVALIMVEFAIIFQPNSAQRKEQEQYFTFLNRAESLERDRREIAAYGASISELQRKNKGIDFFAWSKGDQDTYMSIKLEVDNIINFYNQRASFYNSNMMQTEFKFAGTAMAGAPYTLPREFELIESAER